MSRNVKLAVLEALVVVAAGLICGLTANALGEQGLAIGRDHFKKRTPPPTARTSPPDDSSAGTEDPTTETPEEAADGVRMDDEGYQLLSHDEVVDLQQSAAYLEERCIFIDARSDVSYAEGHIPGAFQLDHYRAERYLDDLLPIGMNAEKIVLYCHGGKCEDSKLAAGDLMENGVNPRKIFIYTGGVSEWKRDGLPCERGARLSGDLVYLEPD